VPGDQVGEEDAQKKTGKSKVEAKQTNKQTSREKPTMGESAERR